MSRLDWWPPTQSSPLSYLLRAEMPIEVPIQCSHFIMASCLIILKGSVLEWISPDLILGWLQLVLLLIYILLTDSPLKPKGSMVFYSQ